MLVLLVGVLGGLGAATRFVVDGALRSRWTGSLPLATFVVNVSGSALLGLLTGASLFHGLGTTPFTAAATGFCGGYTTFSTAMVETVRLVQAEDYRRAAVYALGSLLVSTAAAGLGVAIAWLTR